MPDTPVAEKEIPVVEQTPVVNTDPGAIAEPGEILEPRFKDTGSRLINVDAPRFVVRIPAEKKENIVDIIQEIPSSVASLPGIFFGPSRPKDVRRPVRQKTLNLGGGMFFLSRKDWRLLQRQNERDPAATQQPKEPEDYQLTGPGIFTRLSYENFVDDELGDYAVAHRGNFSFAWTLMSALRKKNQARPVPAGAGTGAGTRITNSTVIPLLNPHDVEDARGLAVQIGGDPDNVNTVADTNFAYVAQQWEFNFDLIDNNLYINDWMKIDGIFGLAMMYLEQDFELHTEGININSFDITETSTHETLQDILVGSRIGTRSYFEIGPYLSLHHQLLLGLYADYIYYEGFQQFAHASFIGRTGVHDFDIVQKIKERRLIVPRIETLVGLTYHATPTFSFTAGYRFDVMMEVASIDHPRAVYNAALGGDVINHPVRLASETLRQQYIEFRADLQF